MPVGNPVTDLSTTGNFVPVTRTLTINGVSYDLSADRSWSIASPGGGSVTSVAMTVPTGFTVTGSPITTAGTLAVTFASGYALPTTVKQSNWDDAYTFVSNFPSQTGNNGKFLYTSGSVLSWQPVLQNPMSNYGEMIFGGTSGVPSVVSPNTTVNRQYLQQIGNGTAAFAPSWGGIISSDITGQALTKTDDTNVTLTLGGTPGNSVLNAVSLTLGWTGQLSAGRGGTGTSGVTGIMLGNSTAPVTGLTGIGGQILRANPSTGAYEFWTPTYMDNPMSALGQIIYSGAGGQPLALNANSTANNMYLRSVSAGTPSWATIQGGDIVGAAITRTNDTNVQITLGGATSDGLLRAISLTMGWTGQLSPQRGGTGASTITGVVIGNGIGTMTGVAGTAGQLLRRDATNSFYEFFTPTYLSNPMTTLGDIIYGNAAGAPLRLAANASGSNQYLRSVSSGAPGWASIAGTDVTGAAVTTSNDTNILITASGNTTNALLRTMTLTAGWTGQLAVGRGGSGAATLTGVLIGNDTSAFTGVAGTANQMLRRNSANTAYEFFTPSFPTGSGTTNYLPKWTSSNVLGDSQIIDNGTNVGIGVSPSYKLHVSGTGYFTNTLYAAASGGQLQIAGGALACGLYQGASSNILYIANWTTSTLGLQVDVSSGNVGVGIIPSYKLDVNGNANVTGTIYAGNVSATNGSIIVQDNYSSGHLTNFGTSYSSGAPVIGFGVTPSTSTYGAFLSATTLTSYPRSAIVVDSDIYFYTGVAQSVAVGSSVSMLEVLKMTNAGTLQIKQGDLQLSTTKYLNWGGAYGVNIPSITGTSGTGAFLSFHPSGSSSGEKMRLSDSGQLRLNGYTSSTSFTGIVQGYLAFTSGGNIITTATPGGVSGTQNYLAKFDSTGIAVGNSRIVDDGTNFLLNGATSVVTGLNLVGNFSATESQGGSILLRRSAIPVSGDILGLIDGLGITTGSTYQQGAGIEFRASQNWNSTSAGTNVVVQTAPDNTLAPADMFVFLNNGAVRFIGRTSNPIGAAAGTMYYNSSANNMRYFNGTTWITF